jgi:hypothetical protein
VPPCHICFPIRPDSPPGSLTLRIAHPRVTHPISFSSHLVASVVFLEAVEARHGRPEFDAGVVARTVRRHVLVHARTLDGCRTQKRNTKIVSWYKRIRTYHSSTYQKHTHHMHHMHTNHAHRPRERIRTRMKSAQRDHASLAFHKLKKNCSLISQQEWPFS